jgi:hypothetical protein
MLAASIGVTASDRHGNLMTAEICGEPAIGGAPGSHNVPALRVG